MFEKIKNTSILYKIGLAGVLLSILSVIAFIVTDLGDRTFSWFIVALVLTGSMLYVAKLFINFPLLTLLSSFCFSVATAYSIYLMLPTLSDIWNNVHFIGGNPVQTIVFTSLFFLSDVTTMIACFDDGKAKNGGKA